MKKVYFALLLFSALLLHHRSFATHLRAGEITAVRISNTSLTYRVIMTTYTDELNGKTANDAEENVVFYPGFRNNGVVSYNVPRKEKVLISPTTVRNTYETVITFPGPGAYKISCGIANRNENTLNLPGDTSSITWFVQTTLVVNAGFGLNSTPVLLNIPVDSAAVGVKFIHNPGAFDIDGDSLSYKLTIPMKDGLQDNGFGVPIDGYVDPSLIGETPIQNEAQNGPATFRIDARTGDLVWDAPQKPGQYNVAFIIEEWRKAPDGSFLRIGEIVRDMQIIVVETDNNRPELALPNDLCVEAGETLKFTVTGSDVDKDQGLKLTSSGGVYNRDPSGAIKQFVADQPATFTTSSVFEPGPVKGTFEWLTNCDHVREQGYDVLFKVEDAPDRFVTQLVDIKTIKVNVNPPRPRGLKGEEVETGVQLSWQPYAQCVRAGTIALYRREGCSGLNPDQCQKGIPADWGYVKIGEVELTDTTYLDKAAVKGQIYSYRLVSDIEVSNFNTMMSAPSTEFCIGSELPKQVPVITNVTVEKTDASAGEILVKWSSPIDLDKENNKGPYIYKLYRTEGLGGDTYQEIASVTTTFNGIADTLFLDKGLNTTDNVYKYKIAFFVESTKLLGEAPPASSVKLKGSPDDEEIKLTWEANTPWINENQSHLVYREDKDKPGVFNIIAEIGVVGPNTYQFTDNGTDTYLADGDQSITLENNVQYCYKVETVGQYENAAAKFGLLHNFSQTLCVSPSDRTPPCAPNLSLDNIGCEAMDQEDFCEPNAFINELSWENPEGSNCREDIIRHNVYFSRYENGSFEQVGFADGTSQTYNHKKNTVDGFAGCYYITAVSSLNVESERSNVVCADNCDKISFPNVFSPNGDGKNDTFQPMSCPAFVKHISYEIYNRQGLLIADGEGDSLAWNGSTNSGKDVSAGTYFYLIKVQFNRLEENAKIQTYKGWLDLIR